MHNSKCTCLWLVKIWPLLFLETILSTVQLQRYLMSPTIPEHIYMYSDWEVLNCFPWGNHRENRSILIPVTFYYQYYNNMRWIIFLSMESFLASQGYVSYKIRILCLSDPRPILLWRGARMINFARWHHFYLSNSSMVWGFSVDRKIRNFSL